MNTLARFLIIAALAGLAPAIASTQDDPPPPAAGASSDDAQRDAARRRITTNLERLRAQEERLLAALDALDAGAPLEDVRRAAIPNNVRDRLERRRGRGADELPSGDRFLEFVERRRPEIAAQLRELRDADPEAFREKLAEIRERIGRDAGREASRDGAPDRKREMESRFRQLEQRAETLAAEITAAAPEEAAEKTLELRRLVVEGFAVRFELTKAQAAELRRRVESLAEQVEHFEQNRDRMIDQRVRQLLDEAAAPADPTPGG